MFHMMNGCERINWHALKIQNSKFDLPTCDLREFWVLVKIVNLIFWFWICDWKFSLKKIWASLNECLECISEGEEWKLSLEQALDIALVKNQSFQLQHHYAGLISVQNTLSVLFGVLSALNFAKHNGFTAILALSARFGRSAPPLK